MKNSNLPYKECDKCKTLEDCAHPDVTLDGFSTPLPPDNCPCPISIMKETIKKRKALRRSNEIN